MKLPVYSFYGERRRLNKEILDAVIVFDLQDIGARYYPDIYIMETCAEHKKHFVVLDQPNPISVGRMEGSIVLDHFRNNS